MAGSRSKVSVTMSWGSKHIEAMTQKALRAGLAEGGKHGRRAIKARLAAGGAETPGMVSGTLRRSVGYRVKSRKGKYVLVDVGVLRPSTWDSKAAGKSFPGRMHAQALRLARGYVGTDRAGRTFNQRPRPFVEPTLNAEKDAIARVVRNTAETWMPKPKEKA